MYNKDDRKDLAQETLSIIKGKKKIDNYNPNEKLENKFYDSSFLDSLTIKKDDKDNNNQENKSVIEVVGEGIVQTVIDLYDKYKENVCILNFASGFSPCGGFLNGAMAQEEAIAYCSNLYKLQTDKQVYKYYNLNRDNNSCVYLDNMILSEVVFFRDEKFNILDISDSSDGGFPKVSIVTAPAVNLKRAKRQGEKIAKPNDIMENRMRKILKLMAHSGKTNIVLGAFGCGAYGNDNRVICKIWHKLLIEENLQANFESITFAILNTQRVDNKTEYDNVFGKYKEKN